MKINLIALKHNLDQFCQYLKPDTKLLLTVKAFAYGTGLLPIAQWAEKTGLIKYLAVVHVIDGVDLRRSGDISLPIMIMLVADSEFDVCHQFCLEPVIYSMHLLDKLIDYLDKTESKMFYFFKFDVFAYNHSFNRSNRFSTYSLEIRYWFASLRH